MDRLSEIVEEFKDAYYRSSVRDIVLATHAERTPEIEEPLLMDADARAYCTALKKLLTWQP